MSQTSPESPDRSGPATVPEDREAIVREVRDRYARIAAAGGGCGCSAAAPTPEEAVVTADAKTLGYAEAELAEVPEGADLGLGCGAPIGLLELQPGERVLDLGSGGGLDAFLAARAVGPEGRVVGVDMTPEMIERARRAAAAAGLPQVEFRQGRLEELPVADGSVDAVTSNCVINLVPDKERVFREMARVLAPGGRAVISDVVLERPLPEAIGRDLLAWVGCVAGAEVRGAYFDAARRAGLERLEILRDVDALELLGGELPPEAVGLLERLGVDRAAIDGTVRSVTWRAWR